jgi:hypothetical protein
MPGSYASILPETLNSFLRSLQNKAFEEERVDVLPRHKYRGFHSASPSPIEGSGDAEEDSWTLGH